MNPENKDIPLNFIREKRLLKERSLNNCSRAGLKSLNDIINHYLKYATFIDEGCGEKSNMEMIKFCNQYIDEPQKINELYKEYNSALKKPKHENNIKPSSEKVIGIPKPNKLNSSQVLRDEKALVKLIISRRKNKGLSQADLAKMIGCSAMTINLFEHRGRNISINKIFAICKCLGIVISWEISDNLLIKYEY